jgi:hypothetical protein
MRQQKAIAKSLATAVVVALVVPLSVSAAPAASAKNAASYAGLADLASSATLIDAWRDYALASLRPDFSWASDNDEPVRAPSLFERGRARLLPPASHFNSRLNDTSPFHVAVASTRVSDTPLYAPAGGELLPNTAPGLQRYFVTPSISQRLGSFGAVSFSAIFAYQHFAAIAGPTPAVSPVNDFTNLSSPADLRSSDTSSGAGLRIDYNGNLGDDVSWQFGVQSRINMEAMNNYRGLYAETGTFDIPASANLGVGYSLTPDLRVDAGVERVMYSQVAPFTSPALPARFLALLSSSVSPEFAWQNLSVYSVGSTWRDPLAGSWSVRVATREQPLPTSYLLEAALPAPSTYNYSLGYARAVGDRSSLHFSASYAPTDFILGLPLSYTVSHGGNQMQYEALWVTSF